MDAPASFHVHEPGRFLLARTPDYGAFVSRTENGGFEVALAWDGGEAHACEVGSPRTEPSIPRGMLQPMESTDLEHALGYTFRSPVLLVRALTHPSYTNENPGTEDNQVLEFLGDAVLGCAVAHLLVRYHPSEAEDYLTLYRSWVAKGPALAGLGRELGVGAVLRLGAGEAGSGGAQRTSVLEDAVEAVLGAIVQDGGYGAASAVVERLLSERLLPKRTRSELKDPISRLKEWGDANGALLARCGAGGCTVASAHFPGLPRREGPDGRRRRSEQEGCNSGRRHRCTHRARSRPVGEGARGGGQIAAHQWSPQADEVVLACPTSRFETWPDSPM